MKKKELIDLISNKVKVNKRTVSMPIATWELIEIVLKKIKIEIK